MKKGVGSGIGSRSTSKKYGSALKCHGSPTLLTSIMITSPPNPASAAAMPRVQSMPEHETCAVSCRGSWRSTSCCRCSAPTARWSCCSALNTQTHQRPGHTGVPCRENREKAAEQVSVDFCWSDLKGTRLNYQDTEPTKTSKLLDVLQLTSFRAILKIRYLKKWN